MIQSYLKAGQQGKPSNRPHAAITRLIDKSHRQRNIPTVRFAQVKKGGLALGKPE